MSQNRVCAILLAAGSGSRMNIGVTKQRLTLRGKSVLLHSLEAFDGCDEISDIILVVRDDEVDFAASESKCISKLRKIVVGGKNRVHSAHNGFFAIDFPVDFVAIHDAARCLITPSSISKVVRDAFTYGAASASSPVVDTVKRINSEGFSVYTEKREDLRLAATPQIFRHGLYFDAISSADINDPTLTDDNMLMEKIGVPVYMTDTGKMNIKITHAQDLVFAEYILGSRND